VLDTVARCFAAALWVVLGFLLAACGAEAAESLDCTGPFEVEAARIDRVRGNGTLVLSDGKTARLEGIRLPRGGDDHAPQSFADQARIAVAKLTLGRQLKLATVPISGSKKSCSSAAWPASTSRPIESSVLVDFMAPRRVRAQHKPGFGHRLHTQYAVQTMSSATSVHFRP
jgi:hypothetical protein